MSERAASGFRLPRPYSPDRLGWLMIGRSTDGRGKSMVGSALEAGAVHLIKVSGSGSQYRRREANHPRSPVQIAIDRCRSGGTDRDAKKAESNETFETCRHLSCISYISSI